MRVLESSYKISLPLPLFPGPECRLSRFKRFCSAPLERKSHPWDEVVLPLSKYTRFSIWMSLFLFRKAIPAKAPPMSEFLEKASTPSPEPDPLFLEYLRNEVPLIFKKGWDKPYGSLVENASATTSACAQVSRCDGGNRMYWLEQVEDEARNNFIGYLKGQAEVRYPLRASRVVSVDTGGKVRVLTVPPAEFSLLRPLNSMMYNHISKLPWLLRGDAKPNKFSDFKRVRGEVFVSGDYESATDSLNMGIQKEILRLVLQQCDKVPNSIRRLAVYSQSSCITDDPEDESGRPLESGQMMGFPLSFPLLCLVNYLTFKYYTMDDTIPVKVNGDDIVFRAKPQVFDRWAAGVKTGGLVLSKGKTLVDSSMFTLNSCLFTSSFRNVKFLPFIRSKALWGKDHDEVASLHGRFHSAFPGFHGKRRELLRSTFLSQNWSLVHRCGRSLTRGMGLPVTEQQLKDAHMWQRELAYLELPREKPPPMAWSKWSLQPEGYEIAYSESRRVLKDGSEEKADFIEACTAAAWQRPKTEEDYDLYACSPGPSYRKVVWSERLLGCTRKELRERRAVEDRKIWEKRKPMRVYPYWRKSGGQALQLRRSLQWVRAETGENYETYYEKTRDPAVVFEQFAAQIEESEEPMVYIHEEKPALVKQIEPADHCDGPSCIRLPDCTVWDCSTDDQVLVLCKAELAVKVYKDGIGIGPPPLY
jgi:hypothetical protein